MFQERAPSRRAGGYVAVRSMATSSDVMLSSRYNISNLTTADNIGVSRTPPAKPKRGKKTGPADPAANVNVAAIYGIDTGNSWATVSTGSGLALRNQKWRSDADLYAGGSQTVSLATSPALRAQQQPQSNGTSSVPHGTVSDCPVQVPTPPPRTKRKARAPLPPAFNAPATDIGLKHATRLQLG